MLHVRQWRSSFWASLFLSVVFGLTAPGCDDDEQMTGPDDTTTTTVAPPGSTTGFLRAAQLTLDARTVDVAIDGEIIAPGLAYPGVSRYVELPAGQHRVQFLPEGSAGPAILETTVRLGSNEALTTAILGRDPMEIVTFRDDRGTAADSARLRLFNAVPDFPAGFGMSVTNGPQLFDDVEFATSSGYESLVPGIYALTLMRAGTREELAMLLGAQLSPGTTSTVFAVGSLARDDIDLVLARDAP